jgi:hypothetical protein
MPTNDSLKSARQMIDDLINDNVEGSKQNFHDFLRAKTIKNLNPDFNPDIDDVPMGDDGESLTDDSLSGDGNDEEFIEDDEANNSSDNEEEEN